MFFSLGEKGTATIMFHLVNNSRIDNKRRRDKKRRKKNKKEKNLKKKKTTKTKNNLWSHISRNLIMENGKTKIKMSSEYSKHENKDLQLR